MSSRTQDQETEHQDHDHDHDHNHDHSTASPMELRVRALETILIEKGLVDPRTIDAIIDTYENKVGPRNGAHVVAKAWTDPDFKRWILRDGTAAIASLGYAGLQGENMVVLENTSDSHNLVVCTLCSCYPWPVLGLPPSWYKSLVYRARAISEPRKVLEEFGLTLPPTTAIKVWDSTSEVRYLVLPMQPAETEGWEEERLTKIVTRNSMVGTGLPVVAEGALQ